MFPITLPQSFRILLLASLSTVLSSPAVQSETSLGSGSHPSMASDRDGRLLLIYEDSGIRFRRSGDQGKTWGSQVSVCSTRGGACEPSMAVEPGGAIDVVWGATSGILFARSSDGGQSWTPPFVISGTSEASSCPSIASGPDGSLHVVWSDSFLEGRRSDVFYCSAPSGASPWTRPFNLSHSSGQATSPVIVVGQRSVAHVAWVERSSGGGEILYTRSCSDGWKKPLCAGPGLRKPELAVDSYGTAYVVWARSSSARKLSDIYVCTSSKGDRLSIPSYFGAQGDSGEPCATIDRKNHLVVVWADTSADAKGPSILSSQSANLGVGFTDPVPVSLASNRAHSPRAVIARDRVVVVWEGQVGGGHTLKLASVPKAHPHGYPRK